MKLKNKFYLLFFASTLLVLFTLQMISLHREKEAFYKRLEERGLALSQTLSLASINSFVTSNFSDLNFYINELIKDKDIEYIIITDPQGKVILTTDYSRSSDILYDPVSIRAVRAKGVIYQTYKLKDLKIYEISSPIQFSSIRWGNVRIGFSLESLNQQVKKAIQLFLLLTLAVIAGASLIFLIIGDRITHPIEKLIQATENISRGNFSVKIPVKSKDEVGRLSSVFNRMVETLKEEKEKLEEANKNSAFYNERLERKIQTLQLLNRATKALRTSLSSGRKFSFILSISMNISRADQGVFFSLSGKKLLPRATRGEGIDKEFFTRLAQKVANSGKALGVINQKEVSLELNLPLKDIKRVTAFAYPLMAKNSLWGIVVLNSQEKGFDFDELQMVSTFLEEANLIMENSFLLDLMLESRQLDSFNRLASIILHDLRGAISKLSLSLHNARRYYNDPQFKEDFLATISASVKKIQSLTEKIGEHPAQLELKPYSVNQILKEVVEELGLRSIPGISLREKYGDIPLLMLDASSIKRVFRNIMMNALEAMPEGGILEIKSLAKISDSQVYVEIKDSGVGMSQDFIESRLFKPFVSTKEKGLGLALYSAREIVRLHGGEIEVESAPRKGTLFRIKIPLFAQNARKGLVRKRLGQYLLDMGVISEEKLKKAMQVQATDKRRIGRILIDMGYIRRSEIEIALEKQREAEKKMLERILEERL